MLDLDSCPWSHSRWVNLTWALTSRLTQSLSPSVRITLISLLVLGAVCLFWIGQKPSVQKQVQVWLRHFRWNRRRTKALVVVTVLCLLVTSPPGILLLTQALTSQVPADSGAKADAIVVLGRGWRFMGDRIDVAATLWQEKRAPQIFVSGAGDAKWIVRQLVEKGVPRTAIRGENCSKTTAENAQYTADLLKPKSVKQIILVTDAPHMVRSRLTFQAVGFEVIPHTNALPDNLGYRENAAIIFREYAGMLNYVITGRFNDRDPTATKNIQSTTISS